jgi:DNA-binding NarL/FixJ family response regulator
MNRFLVADDHALMREGILQLLNRHFPQAHVDTAASYEEVLGFLRSSQTTTHYSLVLLDLHMPGMRGLDSVTSLVKAGLPAPFIACTGIEAPDLEQRLLGTGVVKMVSKTGHSEDLLKAITSIGLNIQTTALQGKDSAKPEEPINHASMCNAAEIISKALLTQRQYDILRMLHMGKPNKIIARELDLALGTVKNHLYTLFTRLQVNSRSQALVKTRDWFL